MLKDISVGLDEVGRGCLAGPVVAAAVVLNPDYPIAALDDSKKLTEKKRITLSHLIKQHALDWSIGRAEACEIDQINILNASLLAMKRAVDGLSIRPSVAKVDGIHAPDLSMKTECYKGGDGLIAEISAASIIAKVYRDEHMKLLDKIHKGYGLQQHKGYPTASHRKAIETMGPSDIHRRSFKLIQNTK